MQPNQPTTNNPNDPQHALRVMAEGEQVVCDIHRHPIGLFFTYISFAFMLLLVGAVAIAAPNLLPDFDQDMVTLVSLSTLGFVTVFLLIIAAIYHRIYYGNRWIVTDDSLTQYEQRGLFNRQSSQLGMDSLEDVTVLKRGIMQYIFNYGKITAQTAGENSKFQFIYCPKPEDYAQKMLAAHERFEEREQWRNRTSTAAPAPTAGTGSPAPR